MTLDPDILERINVDFHPENRRFVIDVLSARNGAGRIARCILFAAQGSIRRLGELLTEADLDFRNVIVAGEYDLGRCMRDLRVSFLIDSPQDFWISNVAITTHKHGYQLSNLETKVVSEPPFAGVEMQGTATFTNDERTFTVQKRSGLWSIVGFDCNFASFGLDSPLADEERFRIQLDFLLSRTGADQCTKLNPLNVRLFNP